MNRRLTYARYLAWYVLRNHPDADSSFLALGRRYKRDHTTAIYGVTKLHWLIVDGRGAEELRDLQWICDQLARRGFRPFSVWHNL